MKKQKQRKPAKSKLENKRLRQKKLRHPAGLQNENSKEFVQAKLGKTENEKQRGLPN